LNFGGVSTARYRYRTPAVTAVTAVYRAVPSGKKNPANKTTTMTMLWYLPRGHCTVVGSVHMFRLGEKEYTAISVSSICW
jgi:hypothetical protein